jgi:hypothetical protein
VRIPHELVAVKEESAANYSHWLFAGKAAEDEDA